PEALVDYLVERFRVDEAPVVSAKPAEPPSLRQRLDAAAPQERATQLLAVVRTEVARALQLADADDLHPEKALPELGMDSLMAVDIRRRLEHRLSMQLPPTIVFDAPSCGLLADYLVNSWTATARTS
ncbi:MAG TPA: acyl carrier protein, partial [Labilithrix sp.]|nr:acyl carrier protein [Labilithrix sp.]